MRGLERAIAAGVREIAVFTAASETFNRRNIHAGIDESIERFQPVVARAAEERIRVRGYVSTAFGCPYEGEISPEAVREVVHKLLDLRDESRRDTIGVATPARVRRCQTPTLGVTRGVLACTCTTPGTALANVYCGLGAASRPSTPPRGGWGDAPTHPALRKSRHRSLLYSSRLGIETGVTLPKVVAASRYLSEALGRRPPGRYLAAVWEEDVGVPVVEES